MQQVQHLVYHATRLIERMSVQHWIFLLIAIAIVGVICMRGIGSRASQ